jgi:hypothetical protein
LGIREKIGLRIRAERERRKLSREQFCDLEEEYGSDSTWADTGRQGVYDINWEMFDQSRSLFNDYYNNNPTLGLLNYPLHTATANAQILTN